MWTLQFYSTCEGPGFGVAVADPVAAGDSTEEADQVPTQRCRYAGDLSSWQKSVGVSFCCD